MKVDVIVACTCMIRGWSKRASEVSLLYQWLHWDRSNKLWLFLSTGTKQWEEFTGALFWAYWRVHVWHEPGTTFQYISSVAVLVNCAMCREIPFSHLIRKIPDAFFLKGEYYQILLVRWLLFSFSKLWRGRKFKLEVVRIGKVHGWYLPSKDRKDIIFF